MGIEILSEDSDEYQTYADVRERQRRDAQLRRYMDEEYPDEEWNKE